MVLDGSFHLGAKNVQQQQQQQQQQPNDKMVFVYRICTGSCVYVCPLRITWSLVFLWRNVTPLRPLDSPSQVGRVESWEEIHVA